MLFLTRKEQERITIGDEITIVVLRAKNGEAKIGIEAPKDIPILRDNAKNTQPRKDK